MPLLATMNTPWTEVRGKALGFLDVHDVRIRFKQLGKRRVQLQTFHSRTGTLSAECDNRKFLKSLTKGSVESNIIIDTVADQIFPNKQNIQYTVETWTPVRFTSFSHVKELNKQIDFMLENGPDAIYGDTPVKGIIHI